ncbi:NADH dehydrogenase 1 alpha subcomplex 6 [Phakopsora pachyrhizi]|uniref:NADH dehydrogenase 1 alpha subcomplex 6 n=1 Tax=Phakopsora pachyrhizi TaxID=170000 RepID=A0AAV0AP04_PHAPC|nr:NADH dehydrogenase 1 alpha subcomplex 6 [Phakopsora pachyrhizi]
MQTRVATTIPSRLARVTTSSPNLDVARFKSRSLYRDWYRAAPEICQLYALDLAYPVLRAKIRQIFNSYAEVRDVQSIDVLIAKSHMEYQEMMNVWKMPTQVMRYFEKEQGPALPKTFMEKFLAGKDGNAVRPGA